ncbi:hypothetical protein [Laspinema palackyanum]|uniref:hypothetical protein n=1 Tax=Laspinema palackyanum TaxID=3231601 RepID=UPI00345D0822|nr:hypothetical protein [Laspinema sp. D2c]
MNATEAIAPKQTPVIPPASTRSCNGLAGWAATAIVVVVTVAIALIPTEATAHHRATSNRSWDCVWSWRS